jgi:hypothetical protein
MFRRSHYDFTEVRQLSKNITFFATVVYSHRLSADGWDFRGNRLYTKCPG